MAMDLTYSLFPKFYRDLDVPALAELVREVGLDTTNVVVREGFAVSPETLSADLPRFMRSARSAGLEVRFATTGYTAAELLADETPLKVLAGEGIAQFRMGYFRIAAGENVRAAVAAARAQLEELAPLCERHGIQAVYQLHHGSLAPSASMAWRLVEGLPAEHVAVEVDPGNQSIEGYENWRWSVPLLGEYVAAAAIKDSAPVRDPARAARPDKGWGRQWVPLDEGVVNWEQFVSALSGIGFAGTVVFMPFYDPEDRPARTARLRRDVAYLKAIVARSARQVATA